MGIELSAVPETPDFTIVGVTDGWHGTAAIHHRRRERRSRLDARPEFGRKIVAIGAPAQATGDQELQRKLVIATCLLKIDAIAAELQQGFALENRLRFTAHAPRWRPPIPDLRGHVHPRRFADEM
ncbi:MAG: hypothetical protein ABI887_19495, partial [Burkholderiales bacterium]